MNKYLWPILIGSIILVGFFLGIFFVSNNTFAAEKLPTKVELLLLCGDGYAEHSSGEVCDPGDPPTFLPDIGTTTCADYNDLLGDPFASGDILCLDDCTGFSTSTCYTCGNSHKEEKEDCDGSDFGSQTCTSFGFESGNLICTPTCVISTGNCEAMENEGGIPGGGPSGGSGGSTSGFDPGSETEEETKVVIRGKSYPHSDVHILVDGVVIGIVQTDAKADFYFETNEVTPGVASFSFWSEDKDGLKSTLLSLTFRVVSRAVTTITGVYIAPTIDIDKQSVIRGEDVTIFGQTVPETQVKIHINSENEFIKTASSSEVGDWSLLFDTEPLEEDFHTAKALFEIEADGNVIQSGFSRSISFYIGRVGGEAACAEGDLNKDGRVNLTDFSILLFYWGTDNACADQNQNGIVDLVDFSIMMYYWTG